MGAESESGTWGTGKNFVGEVFGCAIAQRSARSDGPYHFRKYFVGEVVDALSRMARGGSN